MSGATLEAALQEQTAGLGTGDNEFDRYGDALMKVVPADTDE